jgi:hypothetical protein
LVAHDFAPNLQFYGDHIMNKLALLCVASLGLAACQTTVDGTASAPAGGMQLASQSDMNAITGRTLTFGPDQSFVISGNGTLNGSWDGAPLVGTYEMRDGFFCRTLSQGPRGPSPEDCQLFILDGNTINVTRERGTGVSFDYTVS